MFLVWQEACNYHLQYMLTYGTSFFGFEERTVVTGPEIEAIED